MPVEFTPARRRGVEHLDDPSTPDDVRGRVMADLVRSNRLFGGARSAMRVLRDIATGLPARAVLLDVGTGLADLPSHARRDAARRSIALTTIGVDVSEPLLRTARANLDAAICADASRLPFADASVDVVSCSQLLHHFEEREARQLIAELHRVARQWVVINDLQRSWFAAGGFWTAATMLGFHPITRHDGVVSVLRGFTAPELESLVRHATGITPRVRSGAFWRISAVWRKDAPRHGVA